MNCLGCYFEVTYCLCFLYADHLVEESKRKQILEEKSHLEGLPKETIEEIKQDELVVLDSIYAEDYKRVSDHLITVKVPPFLFLFVSCSFFFCFSRFLLISCLGCYRKRGYH